MHVCQLYDECLQTLRSQITEKKKYISSDSPDRAALDQSIATIEQQIELDIELLKSIQSTGHSIADTKKQYSFLANVFITQWSGRDEKIRKLEAELLNRVHTLTLLMTRDVWKVIIEGTE